MWYNMHEKLIRSLKTPIHPSDMPLGNFKLLETVVNTGIPIRAKCGVCAKEYKPTWDNIRAGRAMTCGCASVHISSASIKLAEFIKTLGVSVIQEYAVNKLKYDIAVESHKLLIEYNGTKWHSSDSSKKRDSKKRLNALSNGWSIISISEDEWIRDRLKIEGMLRKQIEVVSCDTLVM